MFNWFKNRKIKKQIQQNMAEIKHTLLDITISSHASKTELDHFYTQIKIWNDVLTQRSTEFEVVIQQLDAKDKLILYKHLLSCLRNYVENMSALNKMLTECIEAVNISPETKLEIINFGKENIAIIEKTHTVLDNLITRISKTI